MSELAGLLARVSRDLARAPFRWALVGGLAVGARTEPRFTRDVDLAVAVAGDEEAEQVVRALHARGYRLRATLEQTSTGRLATVRMQPADAGPALVDLLFASTGIEAEVVAEAQPLEIYRGHTVPVAALGHLLAMKVLARDDDRRPQDRADLKALFACAQPVDLALAQAGLRLVETRGCSRGRDLQSAWQQAVHEFRPG